LFETKCVGVIAENHSMKVCQKFTSSNGEFQLFLLKIFPKIVLVEKCSIKFVNIQQEAQK